MLDQLSRGLKNESGNEDLVRRTEAYLSAHFQEPVKMENLEEALNYSGDYLTRSFPTRQGMTPHRYLTMLHRPCEVDAGEYRVLRAGNRRGLRLRRPLRFQPCLSCSNGAYAYPVAEGKTADGLPGGYAPACSAWDFMQPARGGRSFSLRRALCARVGFSLKSAGEI